MSETVIHIRRGDVIRRLVGPRAATVAKQREAEGWTCFEPALPFDAAKAARETEQRRDNYRRMTVAELREEIGRRGLLTPDDAKKADLARTLEEDDAGQHIMVSIEPTGVADEGEPIGDEDNG